MPTPLMHQAVKAAMRQPWSKKQKQNKRGVVNPSSQLQSMIFVRVLAPCMHKKPYSSTNDKKAGAVSI
jgi:hypothetical protein